jgi:hypothetical protein
VSAAQRLCASSASCEVLVVLGAIHVGPAGADEAYASTVTSSPTIRPARVEHLAPMARVIVPCWKGDVPKDLLDDECTPQEPVGGWA